MGSSIFCVRVAIKIFGEALELLHLQNGYYVLTLVLQFFFESSDLLLEDEARWECCESSSHGEERPYDSFIPQKTE